MKGGSSVRKSFAQILKSANVNLRAEYTRLYKMFFDSGSDGDSVCDCISRSFATHPLRGTCLTFKEFNKQYGFSFSRVPTDFTIDDYLNLAEYVYNLIMYFDDCYFLSPYSKNYFFQQINMVIESIGYMYAQDEGITIFVPKVPAAIAVAESNSIPEKLSYELIAYNHHSKKGNLEGKRSLLLALGDLLEPRRKEINKIDSTFCTDLFYLLNNLNIRHNNTAPAPNPKYRQAVASMSREDLENWYDDTYQMCLLAFLRLDHQERKVRFDALKCSIENKNTPS